MKKRSVVYILIVVSALMIVVVTLLGLNPLRRSPAKIKEYIMELTPIGTSMDDVELSIKEQNGWEIINVDNKYGFIDPSSRNMIEEKSIEVFMDDYRNLFKTTVTIFLGFDKESKLTDIYVWKEVDGL